MNTGNATKAELKELLLVAADLAEQLGREDDRRLLRLMAEVPPDEPDRDMRQEFIQELLTDGYITRMQASRLLGVPEEPEPETPVQQESSPSNPRHMTVSAFEELCRAIPVEQLLRSAGFRPHALDAQVVQSYERDEVELRFSWFDGVDPHPDAEDHYRHFRVPVPVKAIRMAARTSEGIHGVFLDVCGRVERAIANLRDQELAFIDRAPRSTLV